MASYDRETDIYEHALARLSPLASASKDVWRVLSPVSGECSAEFDKTRSGGLDAPLIGARRQAVKIGLRLQSELGDRWESAGWTLCPRTHVWCIVDEAYRPKRRPWLRHPPEMCLVLMNNDWSFSYCRRLVAEGSDRCKMHASAQRRRDDNVRKWQEDWDRRRTETARAAALRDDLRELWEMACDELGIDPARRGEPGVPRPDVALVDLEVLMVMLRRIIG